MITWIVTRNIIYPAILIVMVRTWWGHRDMPLQPMHVGALFIPVQAYFVCMNFVWTIDLFTPIVKNVYKTIREKLTDTNQTEAQHNTARQHTHKSTAHTYIGLPIDRDAKRLGIGTIVNGLDMLYLMMSTRNRREERR
jgi:hypothetical protein